jgi:hypothetical protein
MGVVARTGADHAGDGVARAEREHAEPRGARGAPLGRLEDAVHPGDEGAVAAAREDGAVAPGDDLLGDRPGLVVGGGEEEVLVRDDIRERLPDLGVHRLGIRVQEDGDVRARPQDGVFEAGLLGADDHSEHRIPREAVTRLPRFLSNGGATARHRIEAQSSRSLACTYTEPGCGGTTRRAGGTANPATHSGEGGGTGEGPAARREARV